MSESVQARRPRAADVAARAGVSKQTVSNVINGRGGFTETTRARVESAIRELGFQPNRYAQSLRSSRTMLLGFDLPGGQLDPSNPFTITFLRSLIEAASGHGYRVVAFTHPVREPDGFRETARAGAVDGFVLATSPPEDPRPRILMEAGVPFVVMGRTALDLPQNWVDVDNRGAMAAAVDHLVMRGHRKFAYVGHDTRVYWNAERLAGARGRLAEHGFPLPAYATVETDGGHARAKISRLLTGRAKPTAVLTSSDSLAFVVTNVATRLGLAVPSDLAVTGFDAGPLSSLMEPSLTSIRMPTETIVEALIQRLIAQFRGEMDQGGVIVPTELVVGGSS